MDYILSADDFGYSTDTLERTIACFEDGILTGASIMANMPETSTAAAYAKANPQFSFGTHLCYCDGDFERPISEPSKIASLVDERGRFWSTRAIIMRALTGRLKIADIEVETYAQVSKLKDLGVLLCYVDGHGNLHKFAPFVEALKNVLPRFGINKVRRTQDIYLESAWARPNFWLGKHWNKAISGQFTTTTSFYLPAATADKRWPETLLQNYTDATRIMEIGVHPGLEPWRANEEADMRTFANLAKASGTRITSWKDL